MRSRHLFLKDPDETISIHSPINFIEGSMQPLEAIHQIDNLSVSSGVVGEHRKCSLAEIDIDSHFLRQNESEAYGLHDEMKSNVPHPQQNPSVTEAPDVEIVDSESQLSEYQKSVVDSALPENFKILLRSLLEGQQSFDAALRNYNPQPEHELLFKFFVVHFYCKDNKNVSRKKFASVIDLSFEKCLRSISDEKLLSNSYLKRGSSARISAFCLILKKLNQPPIRDETDRIIKTDKLTHKFLQSYLAKSNLLPLFVQELSRKEELKSFLNGQFKAYFEKRIELIASEVKKKAAGKSDCWWELKVPARMILTPIDFDSALQSIERLI